MIKGNFLAKVQLSRQLSPEDVGSDNIFARILLRSHVIMELISLHIYTRGYV